MLRAATGRGAVQEREGEGGLRIPHSMCADFAVDLRGQPEAAEQLHGDSALVR